MKSFSLKQFSRVVRNGALGHLAYCDQGITYAGETNDACGGEGNWGATEMEVWYRVGS